MGLRGLLTVVAVVLTSVSASSGSRSQAFRGGPDNPPEGTKAIAQARTPQARPFGPARKKKFHCRFFAQERLLSGSRLPLLLLAGDIILNPGSNCNACRKYIHRGMDSLQCNANSHTTGPHKQISCIGFNRSQLEMSPSGGSGTSHRATNTPTLICDSWQQPIHTVVVGFVVVVVETWVH